MSNQTHHHPASGSNGLKPGWWSVALACVLAFGGGVRTQAGETSSLECQVKAAFLVKFAMFVEWPAATRSDGNNPFKIGIVGEDPFGKDFEDAVKSEQVNHRPVALRRARGLSELEDCQVVFICTSEANRLEELLSKVAGRPALIVGDAPDFAKRGGMIGFIKEDGKVRFEINIAAAERAGLKLSAKLLQVAKIVVPGKSEAEG
ncbi:MAG: YfiR family protein [Verrucomicrobia bacterium]|jgi:hypothetical protein|nr:YfiR family protein [Verrucomicrobiota bacterium]